MADRAEQKLQGLADSAIIKLAFYAITGVAWPMMLWMGNNVLDRLAQVEAAIHRTSTTNATTELRLQHVERGNADLATAIRMLTERTTEHDYRIRRLEERVEVRPATAPRATTASAP